MQAIRITKPGGPEVLELVRVPIPRPREGEVLLRVAAAGVNRPDVLQRQGKYAPPPDADPLPGLEVAGEIVACGPGTGRFRSGDRVMALTHGGGYAEYCRVHESHCLPVPFANQRGPAPSPGTGRNSPFILAAAIPETFFTVQYNLFMRGKLEAGEALLVHGGSSGIGTTAIQLARAAGATVFTTAGSAEKCRFCEELGAVKAFDYREVDWREALMAETGGGGVDVVLDMVAGGYMQNNIDVLKRDGRYVVIAFLGGSRAELDLRAVLARRLTITGSALRPQTIGEKAAIAANLEEHVLPLLASGVVKPVVYATFPLADAAKAHALMESSRHMGKLVLETS